MIEKIIEKFEELARESSSAQTEAIIGMQGASANFYNGEKSAYEKAIQIVQEVSKDGGWIPCSERLPEENCEVLIAREKNKYEINTGYRTKDFWYDQCYHHTVSDVIAWQPLPAPYQKGE